MPGERTLKMPEIDFVKPKPWDFVALAVLALGAFLMGANVVLARTSGPGSISGGATTTFVIVQLLVCTLGLLVLGKTAKEGTIWGNLFSVGACFAGMSGILLAAALWALA